MPIDQIHQKNAFSRNDTEQRGNAASLNMKWLQPLGELSLSQLSRAGAPRDPSAADRAFSSAETPNPPPSLCWALPDLQPEDEMGENGSSGITEGTKNLLQ